MGTPATWDNCGVASVVNNAPAQFPVGTILVTWTVRDTGGFTATCVQVVQVNDTEPPGITCSSNLVVCASVSGSNIVTWPTPVATDNCSVASVTCDPPSGSWFQVGVSNVTCTVVDTAGNSNSCTFTVSIIRMTLTNVTFSGTNYHPVLQDNGSGVYPPPHWTTNTSWPVCYTRNTHMRAAAVFRVEPPTWSGPVVVYGDSSGPKLPLTTNTASGGTLTVGPITSTNAFANQVDFLNPMSINWSYSLDSGTNWCEAGMSTNQAYVTLTNPATANLFHTVVHLACANPGATTDAQAMANTWAFFAGPGNVTTWDGRPLHYYRQGFAACPTRLPQLLSTDDGNCNAWAELLRACFQANGIESARTTVSGGREFGVNNVAFTEPPPFPPIYAPYNYARPQTTPSGLPGQNTATPAEKLFGVHWIVHPSAPGAVYYDPSYGITANTAPAYTTDAIGAWRHNDKLLDRWAKPADDPARTLSFSDGAWPP